MSTPVCPQCGRAPTVGTYDPYGTLWAARCAECHWPTASVDVDYESGTDAGEVYTAIGSTRAAALSAWSDAVENYLGDLDVCELLELTASAERDIDAGHVEHERLRALARLYRDELTRRHHSGLTDAVDAVLGNSTFRSTIGARELCEDARLTQLASVYGYDAVLEAVRSGMGRRICGDA